MDEQIVVVLEKPVEMPATTGELPKVVVTERPGSPSTGTVMVTPGRELNRVAVSMPAWKQALTRGRRTAAQVLSVTFGGLMTGAPQAALIEALKFFDIPAPSHKAVVALLALVLIPVATGAAGFIHNFAELRAKRDETNPESRA